MWTLWMDPAVFLACSSIGSARKREWLGKDARICQIHTGALVQGVRKRLGLGSFKCHGKSLCVLFFLLPSFVVFSFALKKLLIIISVRFEMQA